MTLAAGLDVGRHWSLDLSATVSRTALGAGQMLSDNGGIVSTAGQIAITRKGILGKSDALRLSVAQPLKIERGEIEFLNLEVIDRQTGERAFRPQTFSIAGSRELVGEITYSAAIGDMGTFGLFGRYETERELDGSPAYILGGSVKLGF